MSTEGEQREVESVEGRFSGFYEGANIVPISYDELPEDVLTHIETNSSKYISPNDYLPRNFSHIYLLTHPDGSLTYIAEQTKTYSGGDTEELAYLVDYIDGEMAGYGELRNSISNKSEYFSSKPFVGFTRTFTEEDTKGSGNGFQRQGLGARRLVEMDGYARARFGAPLNSDTILMHDDAVTDESAPRRIWERFVEEGRAEMYMEGQHIRYRMK